MNYKMLLKKIEKDLEDNSQLKASCVDFIQYVAKASDKSKLDYMSFEIISQIIHNNNYNHILSLAHYLTNPAVDVLILNFFYFSKDTLREEPEEISSKYVYEALTKGIFYDPKTGLADPDYKKHLKIFYTLSNSAKELCLS